MSDSFVFSEVLPINSIVNPNTFSKDYLDLQSPFSFFDFLKYTNVELTPLQFNDLYVQYIKNWGEVKNNTKLQIDLTIEDRYVELLQEITLKYATSDEKRFLSNIDFNDKCDLDIVIPFYSKKIIEICNFYSEKREKLKFKIEKNKSKGTPTSLQESIYETITDVVFSDAVEVSQYQSLIDINVLLKDLNIEIEELYDIYTNYLDNDPTKNYGFYDVKTELRKSLYSSNINDIDANIFINIDQAITNQIFEKVYIFLNQFRKNFAINYDLNKVTLNCKPDDKLFTLINETKPKSTRLVQLRNDLIKKYIGCDFYYITTGSTITDVTSAELLFKADNPSGNLLNRHFPTTASIEEESDLQSCRRIGLFFTPEKNGILYFSVPERKYKIDYTKLEPNKLYIFPDPNLYGNTIGLSRNYNFEYPLIHICDYSKSIYNQSFFYSEGDINSNPYTQDFYAYFSRNQLKDSIYFGKDGFSSNFSSIYDKGIVTKWSTDIYGNQYALIKGKSKRNIINNYISNELVNYKYCDYFGGPIIYSDNTSLPELVHTTNNSWVSANVWSSSYYYNMLIESGIGNIINGLMQRPYIVNETDIISYDASFNYNYVLSSIVYSDLDGGQIKRPDGDVYDFEEKTKFIINEVLRSKNTILSGLTIDDELSPYDIKLSYGSILVKNIVTGAIESLSSALKDQLINKYTNFSDQLNSKILDFNVYNDFIWFRTNNCVIFEKLLYQDTSFIYSGTGENYISYWQSDFTNNVSNPFILENKNHCLAVVLSGCNVESNSFSIIPFIYKINYTTCDIKLINNFDITQDILDFYKNNSVINDIKLKKINKPIIVYNERNDKYAILATIEDQNEFPYLYKVTFNYDESDVTNITPELYKLYKNMNIKTINGFDDQNIINTDLNIRDITSNLTVNISSDGTISFS